MTNKRWSTFYFPFSLSKPTNDKFQAERLVLTRSRTLLPTSSVTLIGIIPSLATLWQTASPDASPLTCSRCVYLKPVAPPPTGVFKWGVLLLVFPHLSQCYFCVMFSFVFSFCYFFFLSLKSPAREQRFGQFSRAIIAKSEVGSPTGRLRVSRAGYVPMCVLLPCFQFRWKMLVYCWRLTPTTPSRSCTFGG